VVSVSHLWQRPCRCLFRVFIFRSRGWPGVTWVAIIDVMVFVNVLSGPGTEPAHVAASDLNGSVIMDGADIQLFVNALLNQ